MTLAEWGLEFAEVSFNHCLIWFRITFSTKHKVCNLHLLQSLNFSLLFSIGLQQTVNVFYIICVKYIKLTHSGGDMSISISYLQNCSKD